MICLQIYPQEASPLISGAPHAEAYSESCHTSKMKLK